MTTVNIYLNYQGNCQEAFEFYKNIFGGDFSYIGKFSDMPPQDGMPPLSDEGKDKIMHIALPISTETMLMGSDNLEGFGEEQIMGNNFSISIQSDSKTQAEKIFRGLSENGKVLMPLNETFWGAYFGTLTDKYGVNWMVNMELNPA